MSNGTSVFDMVFVEEVSKMTLPLAKEAVLMRIKTSKTMNAKNKANAEFSIRKAKTVNSLVFTMTNWILAHPSEGLKVIK